MGYLGSLVRTAFSVSPTLLPLKGSFPVTIVYRQMPAHHVSTPLASYLLRGLGGAVPYAQKMAAQYVQHRTSASWQGNRVRKPITSEPSQRLRTANRTEVLTIDEAVSVPMSKL